MEKCIMPKDYRYSTERYSGLERHEIFEGRTGNRDKSIEDGLVVFLTPEQHRTGKHSVHLAPKEWLWLKQKGQIVWMNYYGGTEEDFRKKYGKSYI